MRDNKRLHSVTFFAVNQLHKWPDVFTLLHNHKTWILAEENFDRLSNQLLVTNVLPSQIPSIFKPGVRRPQPVHTWFLEIDLVQIVSMHVCVCVCVCVCVFVPEAINN